MAHWQLLPEPVMYVSGYLKQHQSHLKNCQRHNEAVGRDLHATIQA